MWGGVSSSPQVLAPREGGRAALTGGGQLTTKLLGDGKVWRLVATFHRAVLGLAYQKKRGHWPEPGRQGTERWTGRWRGLEQGEGSLCAGLGIQGGSLSTLPMSGPRPSMNIPSAWPHEHLGVPWPWCGMSQSPSFTHYSFIHTENLSAWDMGAWGSLWRDQTVGAMGRLSMSGDNQSPEGEFGTDWGIRSRVRWGCLAQPLTLQGQSTLIPDAGAPGAPSRGWPRTWRREAGDCRVQACRVPWCGPHGAKGLRNVAPHPGQLLLEHAVTDTCPGPRCPLALRPRGADLGGRGPQRVREPLPSLLTAWTSRSHLPPKAEAPWKPLSRPRWGKRAGELGASQGQVGSPARLAQGPEHLLRAGLAGGRGSEQQEDTHGWTCRPEAGLLAGKAGRMLRDAGFLLPSSSPTSGAPAPTWTPAAPRALPNPTS